MSEEIALAVSDRAYWARLQARARRWKRAAKHMRRGMVFWKKHYLVLREKYLEVRDRADRERARAEAADARQRTLVTHLVTTYMTMFPGFEYISPEQALAVIARKWRHEVGAWANAEHSEGDA